MGTPAADLVRSVLTEHGPALQAALAGYLDADGGGCDVYALASDYPRRGGRGLRASLCMASARAFGAELEDALNSAISLELLHNAFLVHDDVEDESEERRGRPTLHKLHGVPTAINVGDALAVMSLRPLIANQARLGPRLTLRILAEAERMARESVEGQAIELSWRRENALGLSESDYLRMILKKTCWYTTIYPCRVGALIGTRDGAVLDDYLRFGFFLGAAFQIQDDVLNLVGDPQRYGKEIGGDIWEGKRTLMLIQLLRLASEAERSALTDSLARPRAERSQPEVDWIIERMHHYGCIEYARSMAHGLAGAALHEFDRAFGSLPDTRDKHFLRALPSWVLERA
jgi:geranylgeranyl diphosphate synthase type II